MLEGLDSIAWSKLSHAYGKASDTPAHLRNLTSTRQSKREHARDALWSSINHQGSVYDATAAAVPFLVELATSTDIAERHEILQLLTEIARGSGWHQVHQRHDIVRKAFGQEKIAKEIRREAAWVGTIREEVTKAAPAIAGLLHDGDLRVRLHAANFLTAVPTAAEESVARMKAALQSEQDVIARANLISGITCLAARSEAHLFREEFDRASDPLLRMVSAIGMVSADPNDPPSDALLALFDILRTKPLGLAEKFNQLPTCIGYETALAAALLRAPDELKGQAADALIAEREAATGYRGAWFDVLLLQMVLPAGASELRAEHITDLQRRAIACVARSAWPKEGSIFINASDVLRAFKLPERSKEMDALIGTSWRTWNDTAPKAKRKWWKAW
jgi:hypothetical protein